MLCSQHASGSGLHPLVFPQEHPDLCAVATRPALANGDALPARLEGMMSESPLVICDSLYDWSSSASVWPFHPSFRKQFSLPVPATSESGTHEFRVLIRNSHEKYD